VLAGVQFILPLGITHTIASTGPIITLLIQIFVLKKGSIHKNQLIGCAVAFIGIILTSNGKFIYSFFDKDFSFNT
jgi:drug/metabolite transporter (DMT)-like permease